MSALDKRIFNYIKLVYPYWNVHLCDLLLLSIVDTKRTRFVVYIYSSDGTLNIDSYSICFISSIHGACASLCIRLM